MSKYYVDEYGNITTGKKKKKNSYYVGNDGSVTVQETYNDDEIAPTKGGDKDSWFKSGGFSDGVDGFWDFVGDLGQTVYGTVGDLVTGAVKGVGRLAEGVVDLGTYGVAGVADLFGADDAADSIKKFAQTSYTDEWTEGISNHFDQYSVLGNKGDMISEGIGQVAAIIATGGLAGAAGLSSAGATVATTGLMGLSGVGSGMSEAYNAGASDGDALTYGLLSGTIEAGSELLFGGFGKASRAIGIGRSAIPLDDILAKTVTKRITSRVAKNLTEFGIKASAEGVEELIAGYLGAHAKKGTYMADRDFDEILEDENLLEQFIVGTVTSGLAQSGYIPGMKNGSVRESIKTGRDFVTGYTDSDQTVIDKVVESRVAEAEKNGKKLSKREIGEIEEKVQSDLEKGYISINTIEETLGGEDYKAYKDSVAKDEARKKELEALKKEYDVLYNMKNTEKSNAQIDREAELKAQIEGFKLDSNTDGLKAKLSNNVFNLVKDGKLAESYNEKARKGQAFDADLSKYKGKQREAVERAIKSGVLNNSNRSHELVDILSKIEADKGVVFDYTDNAKLKESGFAVEGKTVNGFEKNGTVTLNVQSAKAWQSTVGHEITHVLEGTEAYSALRDSLYKYAESKGELESRRTALTELYKDMDADIDAELTADLVGDYLFSDSNFIRDLTTNRNLFQKIYDEIKYLCKIATGKELTEIEKVRQEFDKAWKEVSTKGIDEVVKNKKAKTKGKTNHSLTLVDAVQPTSDKWVQSATTDEVRAAHPTLFAVDETATEKRNPTQVKGTVGSYRNIYDSLQQEGFNGTILDASSGLGYGTKVGIEEYGFDVEDIEPYPDSNYKPKYTDYSTLDKTYDVVISNAVLNVLPQDQRDALVVKMGEMLNPGGRMFVNVRGKDVLNASGKIAINEANMEYFIPRTPKTGSYQKGFTKAELKAYLEDALGKGYTVEPTNLLNGVAAIVTKDGVNYSVSAETDSDYMKAVENNDTETAQRMVDEVAKNAGYPTKVMHGTPHFGFTRMDVTKSDDGMSVFATDSLETASTYSPTEGARRIGNAALKASSKEFSKALNDVKTDLSSCVEHIKSQYGVDVSEFIGRFEAVLNEPTDKTKTELDIFSKANSVLGDLAEAVKTELYNRHQSDPSNKKMSLKKFENSNYWRSVVDENNAFYDKIIDNLQKMFGENEGIYELYANTDGHLVIDCNGRNWNNIKSDALPWRGVTNRWTTRTVVQYAKDNGYTGVTFKNLRDSGDDSANVKPATVYAFFKPQEQLKSADPITYDDKGDVIPLSQRFNKNNDDIRYSVSEDSDGNQLSKEQSEYFKDSKAVDENGNLKVMYHTTGNDFTVFDKARKGETTEADNAYMGFFFAESKEYMQNFPEFKGQKTDAYYLDIKNPIDMTNISKEAFLDVIEATGGDVYEAEEIYDSAAEAGTPLTFRRLLSEMIGDYSYSEFYQALEPNFDTLVEKGYDGVINFMDEKLGEKEYIVFDSNQAKLITNTKPTADADTRYSLSSMANTFFGDESMSSVAFEQGDYKNTDGYKNYVEQCVNNMRQTRADFDESVARGEIEEQIDGIVRVALAAKKAGYDIFDDASKRDLKDSKNRLLFSSLEPNSDYFTSSDISTICDKRKNFAEIYDEIVKTEEAKGVPQGKRFFDNVDNYFALHKIMADKGLTQPCRQCYVESMRKNLAPMANAFLRLVNETDANNKANDQLYQQSGKNKGTLKSSNAELRQRVLETFEEHPEYGMTASDLTVETLTTEDGLAQLKIQAPLIYEAFNSFYGQSKPKMPKSATPFRFGELTALLTDHNGKIKQSLVDKINSTGGFRLQSYSDFQIQNYTDVLQVIFEAGTLGLNGHAYTKVPAFLEATEGTNLKRNISIFMYKDGNEWKLDKNDSFPYDLEGIYDIVKADKSGNTGIIAVSQNKEMSAWIMANDYVAYGIPFHKSGMKMGTVRDTDVKTDDGRTIKGYSGTIDHTKQQTEVWAKASDDHKALTKVKKGINIYEFWDFDNKSNLSKNELIEKNVKEYIRQCEIAGYLPKFRDYVINNESVLNDVLRYSKELGFVEQNATIDDISFKYEGKYHSYRIPYGYYKFLGDFSMFTPNGNASPHATLSLNNYNFDKAEQFFADAEGLRRNEILQQFANGEERQKYRDSDLTAEELEGIVKQKRKEVADSIVAPVKNSLSYEGEQPSTTGTPLQDLYLAPTKGEDTNVPTNDAPFPGDIAPMTEEEANALQGEKVKADDTFGSPMGEEKIIGESLIAKDKTKEKTDKGKVWTSFVRNFLDKGSIFEKISLKTKTRALMDKYKTMGRSESKAQYFMEHGKDGVSSLKDIRKKVVDAGLETEFDLYMKHLHNVDRMKYDKPVFGFGVSAEISQRQADTLEAQHPEFKSWANEVYNYNSYLRKLMVRNGIITQDTANLWASRYPHYVPIERTTFDDAPTDDNGTGVSAPTKWATGGNQTMEQLFKTMAHRTEQVFKAIDKNHFGLELKKSLNAITQSADVELEEMLDGFNLENDLKQGEDGKNPTFSVYENGRRVTFEITEEMYDALKPTSDAMAYTFKPLNKASSLHKKVLTEYNLFFAARNAIKDAQDVFINSQHAVKTYANMPQAVKELITGKGSYVTEYYENGGDQNTYFDKNENAFKDKSTFKKIIGLPFEGISRVNEFVEAVPRLAEYIASRKSGATIEASMLDAARVTTDFSAGGDITKFLNRNGATFLNASVQGAMQHVRNVREAKANGLKGVLTLAGKYAMAGLPAVVLNSLLWDDDEEYEELSEYVKDNYYVIAKYGDGEFVRIPKGRTATVVSEIFEQIGKTASGEETDWANVFTLAASNIAPNNPIDNNVLSPLIQAATNTTWYGEDLVPTRLQDVPAEEQFDETIDSISKWLGENTGVSPYKINYLLNQYGGFVGDMILPALTPEAERGDTSGLGHLIAPLKDQFTVDGVMKNQNISDFYSKADELKVNANSSKATYDDILKSKYMSAVNSELGDLYKQKRELQNSNLSDADKYNAVREIQKQINSLAKNSLNTYDDVLYDDNYAVVGDKHYKLNDDGEWQKINDKQVAKQKPFVKVYGGYSKYLSYSDGLNDIKADKDANGKTINGSRKEKVLNYINNLDADYETKLILFKSEYPSDDTYNQEIINYLNNRNDLTYEERVAVYTELGFTVKDGYVYWD